MRYEQHIVIEQAGIEHPDYANIVQGEFNAALRDALGDVRKLRYCLGLGEDPADQWFRPGTMLGGYTIIAVQHGCYILAGAAHPLTEMQARRFWAAERGVEYPK